MQLPDDQVCALIGNAYVSVDAPFLFCKELSSQLRTLGFKMHPLEPCVYYLESWKNGQTILHGARGTHVDDGICGGDFLVSFTIGLASSEIAIWILQAKKFCAYRNPTWTTARFQYQSPPSRILYIKAVPLLEIGKHRRNVAQEPISEKDMSNLRGLIGS